jgi:hypothetical protein
MGYLKDILKTPLSFEAIFKSRKAPLPIAILFFLLINIGFSFPFAFEMLTLRHVDSSVFLTEEEINKFSLQEEFKIIKSLYLDDNELKSELTNNVQTIALNNKKVLINLENDNFDEEEYLAVFTKEYAYLNLGIKIYSDYVDIENTSFSDMDEKEILDFALKNILSKSIGQWFLPIYVMFYLAFLSINTLFVLGMSVLAIIFRIGDKIKLSYVETLKLVIFSSVMPVIISVIGTIPFNLLGLNVLIFDFGTFAVYMIVRSRFLKHSKA